jgi:hypothetical protein
VHFVFSKCILCSSMHQCFLNRFCQAAPQKWKYGKSILNVKQRRVWERSSWPPSRACGANSSLSLLLLVQWRTYVGPASRTMQWFIGNYY